MEESRNDSLSVLMFQIMRLHRSRIMTLLGKLDVHHGQPPVLALLMRRDGLTQKDIAAKLHLTPATITAIIKRMEKAGLLLRRSDPDDRRVARVYLTDKSRHLHGEVEKIIAEYETEWTHGFEPAELEQLRQYFLRLRDNFLRAGGEEPEERR